MIEASFKGIPFFPESASEKMEWHTEEREYITGRKPDTDVYARKPERFKINGFLMGKAAILSKDLLKKSVENGESGRLIHPLYGLREVICTSLDISETRDEQNSYQITLECYEVNKKPKGKIDEILSKVDDAHDALDKWVLGFASIASSIHSSMYALEQSAKLISKVDAFMSTNIGLGLIPESIEQVRQTIFGSFEQAKDVLMSPKKLAEDIVENVLKMNDPLEISDYVTVFEDEPLAHEIAVIGVFAHDIKEKKENKTKAISLENKKTIEIVANREENETRFMMLWKILNESIIEVPKDKKQNGNLPSLVAAYNATGNIESAESLAIEEGNPFAV